jgi:hypothetical protein
MVALITVLPRQWHLPEASAAPAMHHGLTLVYFSAQPKPFLTQNTPLQPFITP